MYLNRRGKGNANRPKRTLQMEALIIYMRTSTSHPPSLPKAGRDRPYRDMMALVSDEGDSYTVSRKSERHMSGTARYAIMCFLNPKSHTA